MRWSSKNVLNFTIGTQEQEHTKIAAVKVELCWPSLLHTQYVCVVDFPRLSAKQIQLSMNIFVTNTKFTFVYCLGSIN